MRYRMSHTRTICLGCTSVPAPTPTPTPVEPKVDDLTFIRDRATRLAQHVYDNGTHVHGIELFGSLSRGLGTSNSDVDLIVCTSDELALKWSLEVHKALWYNPSVGFYSESGALIRRCAALDLLGLDSEVAKQVAGLPSYKLDIFVFPYTWRTRLKQLQEVGHHKDPLFMQNIARDAVRFVPGQGFPFPLLAR